MDERHDEHYLQAVTAMGSACVEVPADWDPLALGLSEVRLGPPGESVLSVKWKTISGGFSTKKHFDKVKKAFAAEGSAELGDWCGDKDEGRDVLPYVWRTGGESRNNFV